MLVKMIGSNGRGHNNWRLVSFAESTFVLASTSTPPNKADHAARLLLLMLTDNWPRVALSLNAVLNKSNKSRSATGAALVASKRFPFPVQCNHVLVPVWPAGLLAQ